MNEQRQGQPIDYLVRVNRAIDYVQAHVTGGVRLDDVAAAAGFSPFHFHRIFKAMTGETLNAFVKRLRLDRALTAMGRAQPASLTQIAHDCGFADASDFSRCFKQRFGVPPSAFDIETYRRERRAELVQLGESTSAPVHLHGLPRGQNPDGFAVELRSLPPRTMAYLRVVEPYRDGAVPAAARQMVAWAETRGLADGRWYGYQWEDPEVVPLEQCRYDIAVEVAPGRRWSESAEPIGRIEFAQMTVAVVDIRGDIELEMRALDWLFRTWLPQSGRAPAAQPGFEAWHGRPYALGHEHFELELHLPLE